MRKYLRRKFINWLVRGLFNAITPEDILAFEGDKILYKGKPLDSEKVLRIREDAERLKDSMIWKLLLDDAKYNANFVIYEKSANYDEMMFGKAVLYAVDILEKRVKQLSSLK